MRKLIDLISLELLRRTPIRHRLIASFIILSLLPLMVSSMLSYAESRRAVEAQSRLFFVEIAQQVARNFRVQMEQLETTSQEFILSDRVQGALTDYYGADDLARARAKSNLTRVLLEKYGSFDFISQKYLLDNQFRLMDAQVFTQLGESVAHLSEKAGTGYRPIWTTYSSSAGQKSIAMLRRIFEKSDNQLAGTLFIGVLPSHFTDIFDTVSLGNAASVFVVDIADGSVLARGRRANALTANDIAAPDLVQAIRNHREKDAGTGFSLFSGADNQAYCAAYAHIANTSWYVVTAATLHDMDAVPESMRNKALAIGLACFVCALLASFVLSRSIAVPIARLVTIMKQTESGNYSIRVPVEGHDEVTLLARRFNDMATQVDQQNERMEERVAERTRDLAHATRSLEILSATDGLTGIANRRRFDEVLAAEMLRATRSGRALTLMMLDVDLFKNYNDFCGHQAGDDCLRAVAHFLQSHSRRPADLVARYGGEEFAIIAAETDAGNALEMAQAICTGLYALGLPHERSPFGVVTVSIGVTSLVPVVGMGADAMIRRADAAMYRAKNAGRNQVCAIDALADDLRS
jgi:diguanylate cyclase (GGDEF)-like protein